MKEVVDVVDLHDNIVCQKSLPAVLKEGLLHRYAVVMLFNPEGELFVCRRLKGYFAGSLEGSVAGPVFSGEIASDAASRLLHECLGVCSAKQLSFVSRFGFLDDSMRVLVSLFVLRDFKKNVEYDADEVKSGSFLPLKKVSGLHPLFVKCLEMMKKFKVPAKDFL